MRPIVLLLQVLSQAGIAYTVTTARGNARATIIVTVPASLGGGTYKVTLIRRS